MQIILLKSLTSILRTENVSKELLVHYWTVFLHLSSLLVHLSALLVHSGVGTLELTARISYRSEIGKALSGQVWSRVRSLQSITRIAKLHNS